MDIKKFLLTLIGFLVGVILVLSVILVKKNINKTSNTPKTNKSAIIRERENSTIPHILYEKTSEKTYNGKEKPQKSKNTVNIQTESNFGNENTIENAITVKFLEPKKQVSSRKITVKIKFTGLIPNAEYQCGIISYYYDYRKRKWIYLRKVFGHFTVGSEGNYAITLNKPFKFKDPGKKKFIVDLYRNGKKIELKNNEYVFTVQAHARKKKSLSKKFICNKKYFKYSGRITRIANKLFFKDVKIYLGNCKGKLKGANSRYSNVILLEKLVARKERLKREKISIILANGKEVTITYAEIKEMLENKSR